MSPAPLPLAPGDTVLVSRTDRIGDLILALPLVQTLKLRYPECHIAVLASEYATPVLGNHPDVADVVTVDSGALRYRPDLTDHLIHRIRSLAPRVAVLLYPDPTVCRIVKQAGVPHRIGPGRRWSAIQFNHWLWHSRRVSRRHEASYNLDYLAFFDDGPVSSAPRVQLSDAERADADRLLREVGIDGRFVLLHPGSGGSADCWPLGGFTALAGALQESGRLCLITGSISEAPLILHEAARQQVTVHSLAGKTSLRQLAALAARADVVLANSTGPLHLAAAVGTRVVGLYPLRAVMSPVRWGPLGTGHRVVQPARPCACRGACTCMATIEVAEVLRAIEVDRDADNK